MRYGGAHGIVFDQPACRAGAQRLVADSGVADRCRFVGGDFFESVPRGGDVYLLKHVIHDWDDEQDVRILRNCHSAMSAESRLLLIEPALPERPSASPVHAEAVASDLNMADWRSRTHRTGTSVPVAGGRVRGDAYLGPSRRQLCLIEARKTV